MEEQLRLELDPWKKHKFRANDLSFEDVVDSIKSGGDLVEAKPMGDLKDQWALFNKATGKVALVTHAAIWSWGSPLDTGNFVPEGEDVPRDLHASKVQPVASPKCTYSYAFDTSMDTSLYDGLKTLEGYMEDNKTFNEYGKPKYSWQKADNPSTNHRYILSARVFSIRGPHNCNSDGTYKAGYRVHPWIQKACVPHDKKWVPNMDKPHHLEYTKNKFKDIRLATPPHYEKGDVLWMCFIVSFVMQTTSWSTTLVPLEMVRVGKVEMASMTSNRHAGLSIDDVEWRPLYEENGDADDENAEIHLRDKQETSKKRTREASGDPTNSSQAIESKKSRVQGRYSPDWNMGDEEGEENDVAEEMEKMDIVEEEVVQAPKRRVGRFARGRSNMMSEL